MARRAWVVVVLVVLGCHEEGSGCHWPWNRDDGVIGALHGEDCEVQDDCAGGLVCAGDGTCLYTGEPGTAGVGDECPSNAYCQAGLVCSATGSCAQPGDPGTAGIGEECDAVEDCQLGLQCKEGGCYGITLPLWFGGECDPPEAEDGPFRAYFEIPGDEPLSEFYRLPFPNDARVKEDGTLDLSGHITPGALIPELGDVVGTVFDLLEEDFTGFGNNEAVFFRFSDNIDYSTLTRGHPHEGGTWGIVDLTPGDTYGDQAAGGYSTSSGRGMYICPRWMGIAPLSGYPFLPGHTYAAYLGSGIEQADNGLALGQDDDFVAMLAETAPTEARLQRGWTAYQPLRDWIAATPALSGDQFAAATVFTAQDPVAPMLALRDAVWAADYPIDTGATLCSGTAGPYADDDDDTRGCFTVDPAFHEIQGTLALPRFQEGTPPFKTVADGGGIDFSDGSPAVQATEQVHFTLTIPKNALMPPSGWPVVIYGHGTGGNYRSAITSGMAESLSDVVLADSTHVAFATLTIDAPQHGPRRHRENWEDAWLALDPGAYDPDVLYFNPLNPRAARDNALQAAADHWAVVRWLRDQTWDAGSSPTGSAAWFDEDELFYMGHSQGSTAGVGFVAYEPNIRGAVFSGAGGLLIESLVNKKKPYDMPAAIALGLADPDIDRYHPVLNLVQGGAERADGINHAPYVHDDPLGSDPARHVFQTFGIDDQYTPNETQEALVRALRLSQFTNGHAPIGGVSQVTLPVSGNRGGITAVTVLYTAESGEDPHFVVFDREDAHRHATHFLGTAVRDGTPTVVP